MIFRTRKFVKPADLNPRGTLFGGRCMEWIDEESAIYAACQLDSTNIVTRKISEMNFLAPAYQGDMVEIGVEVVKIGTTSLTLKCVVQNKNTKKIIVSVDTIVFVCVDEDGKSIPHGVTEVKE